MHPKLTPRIALRAHRGTSIASIEHMVLGWMSRGLRISLMAALLPVATVAATAGGLLLTKKAAHAEGAEADKAEVNERCAIRLAIALVGKSPEDGQLTSANPQAAVDAM